MNQLILALKQGPLTQLEAIKQLRMSRTLIRDLANEAGDKIVQTQKGYCLAAMLSKKESDLLLARSLKERDNATKRVALAEKIAKNLG